MKVETLQTLGKYLIALGVIIGCFVVIAIDTTQHVDATQPWTVIGLIVGWIVRDSAGQSATDNAVKIAAASGGGA